jgi:hypothetical protein
MNGMMATLRRVDGTEFHAETTKAFAFPAVVDEICGMRWELLNAGEVMQVAKAYYYFSIQFRENLEIACRLRPGDPLLQKLSEGECDTDNLSPFPGICTVGEKLNHDEFMRRALAFQAIERDHALTMLGEAYLDRTRALADLPRAASIASYEDGGLSRVFGAMLRSRDWRGAGPVAFRYFLEEHIRFDTDDDEGHGALSRHLTVDDAILPLWTAFRDLLLAAAPRLEPVTTPELMPEAAD